MKRLSGCIACLCLCMGFVVMGAPSGGAGASSLPPTTLPLAGLHPAAAAHPDAAVLGSSCPVAGFCVVVGEYEGTDHSDHGLIETLSGGAWSAATAPLPPAASNPLVELDAVSCATPASCVAVGEFTDPSGHEQGLIETLADGVWSASVMTLPADANPDPLVELWDVSCPSADQCVAVGSYLDTANNTQVLIGTRAGGTWTPSTVSLESFDPAPRPLHYQWLKAVSCPQTGSCVAAGEYEDVHSHMQLFTVTLAGGVWTARPLALSGLDPAPTPAPRRTKSNRPSIPSPARRRNGVSSPESTSRRRRASGPSSPPSRGAGGHRSRLRWPGWSRRPTLNLRPPCCRSPAPRWPTAWRPGATWTCSSTSRTSSPPCPGTPGRRPPGPFSVSSRRWAPGRLPSCPVLRAHRPDRAWSAACTRTRRAARCRWPNRSPIRLPGTGRWPPTAASSVSGAPASGVPWGAPT